MISFREEESGDIPAVRVVNEQAFWGLQEVDIVDNQRSSCEGLLSPVAEHEGQIVCHIDEFSEAM